MSVAKLIAGIRVIDAVGDNVQHSMSLEYGASHQTGLRVIHDQAAAEPKGGEGSGGS